MALGRAWLGWDNPTPTNPAPPPAPPGPTQARTLARTTSPSRSVPRGRNSGAVACDLSANPRSSGPSGMRSRGPGRHSGPGNTQTHPSSGRASPAPGTTNPSKQWAAGRGLRDGALRTGRVTCAVGMGAPLLQRRGSCLPPAGLPAPAHTARWWGCRSEPSVSADRSPGSPGSHPPDPPSLGCWGKGMVGGVWPLRGGGMQSAPP